MPISFPKDSSQLAPFADDAEEFRYSYYHGYRFLDKEGRSPRYSFGHGLSYSEYQYSNLVLRNGGFISDGSLDISVDIKNVGKHEGDEVVQLYLGYENSSVFRSVKDLKGFTRISLKPGELKTVHFHLTREDLAFYSVESSSWEVETIPYIVSIAASASDLRLSSEFTLN